MKNILVTAIGGGGHGHQILKSLKKVAQDRYTIFGADMDKTAPQATLVEDFIALPGASDPSYIDVLLEACERWSVDAVFHGCEPELLAMHKHRGEFAKRNILLAINSHDVVETCMDKSRTLERLRALGFPTPQFLEVTDLAELKQVNWFPVVVKPSIGGGGSANVFVAQDPEELHALSKYLGLGHAGLRLSIQEYVGTPNSEFTMGVLHDLDGNYLNSIAVKRDLNNSLSVRSTYFNRTTRSDLGPRLVVSSGISQGEIGRFPLVTEQGRRIADALGSKGPLNIQCRFVDGQVLVFEVNPRFSGTTSLRTEVGLNEPDILLRRHLFGETVSADFDYQSGVVKRWLQEDFISNSEGVRLEGH